MMFYKLLFEDSKAPVKAHEGDAGYDVFSYVNRNILCHSRVLIDTGIVVNCTKDSYVRVAPRSGLSLRGIDIAAGVIDSGYTGSLGILVVNNSDQDFYVGKGDKIAQLIVTKIDESGAVEISNLKNTSRGNKGYGSSGK